ncbi:MAG TPA: MBL fold metallo-hydrolase [Beijerinckiaceae bacterium]|jgi:L-ascorbate metabolism protein UlaG (beta-lactamase superfamily)|nr:MBL fold metallo-hydrolase [Beijerinckiaceae bacterium]
MRFFHFTALALLAFGAAALGSTRAAEIDKCPDMVAASRVWRAALNPDQVAITFVGHATFLIESPGGTVAATDYNDFVRPKVVPDIATMNKAHSSHYSLHPNPAIAHVLHGWNSAGGPIHHDLNVGEMHIRNVPTNIRDWGGGTEYDANSIFIFETTGLCIAHLGHLHHPLTPEHLKQVGHVDVLLVPVDGSYTLDTPGMMEVIDAIRAPLILPMHYFGSYTLNRFLDVARSKYEVAFSPTSSIAVSRTSLPSRPKMLILPERHY